MCKRIFVTMNNTLIREPTNRSKIIMAMTKFTQINQLCIQHSLSKESLDPMNSHRSLTMPLISVLLPTVPGQAGISFLLLHPLSMPLGSPYYYFFLWLYPWHMEVLGPGVGCCCGSDSTWQLWQCWTLKPLCQAGDWTCASAVTWTTTDVFLTHCTTAGTPRLSFLLIYLPYCCQNSCWSFHWWCNSPTTKAHLLLLQPNYIIHTSRNPPSRWRHSIS